jgi:tRNA A37 threonylcarbamoyladenosine dehydratase
MSVENGRTGGIPGIFGTKGSAPARQNSKSLGGIWMQEAFSDLEALLGFDGINKLARARIAVFGLGGVGSHAAEALARCGVGSLTLVDYGIITKSDIDRQLYALSSTIGRSKVQAGKERIHQIDEDILVHTYETFYGEETADMFDLHAYDYVIDTIGTLSSKLLLIEQAKASKTPVISCMDIANKLNPARFEIADISRTSVCPVAKAIRTELRRKGIRKVKVLFSRERLSTEVQMERGTFSFAAGVAGFMIAGEVVRDLLAKEESAGSGQKQNSF